MLVLFNKIEEMAVRHTGRLNLPLVNKDL